MSKSPTQLIVGSLLYIIDSFSKDAVIFIEDIGIPEHSEYFNTLLLKAAEEFGINLMKTFSFNSSFHDFKNTFDEIIFLMPNGGMIINALNPTYSKQLYVQLHRLFLGNGTSPLSAAERYPILSLYEMETVEDLDIYAEGHYVFASIKEREPVVTDPVEKVINSVLGMGHINRLNVVLYVSIQKLFQIYDSKQILSSNDIRQLLYKQAPYDSPLGPIALFSDNSYIQQLVIKRIMSKNSLLYFEDINTIYTLFPGDPWRKQINSNEVLVCDWSIPAGSDKINYRRIEKVLILATLTGPTRKNGLDLITAAYIVLNEINAKGGVNKYYLNLFIMDDKGDPEYLKRIFIQKINENFRYFFGTNL